MLPFALLYSLGSAALAPLMFGYHIAELNAPQHYIRCPSASPGSTSAADISASFPECIDLSQDDYAFVTSIFALGGLLGAIAGGPMCNKYGRRGSLRVCSVAFALGGAILAMASTMRGMVMGRLVSGLASGAAVVVMPLYVHELAPPGEKGAFGAITQISVNLGILITQALGLFLGANQGWRVILGVGAFLGVVQGVLLATAKESPKWLASNARREEAERVLRAIRRGNMGALEIQQELSDGHPEETEPLITDPDEERSFGSNTNPHSSLLKPTREKVSLYQFLTLPAYRKPLTVVICIMLVQQLTGINAIVQYGVDVLRDLIPGPGAALINVFISALNLLFTWYASTYFDRSGRKPCLMWSTIGMGLSSLALGTGLVSQIPVLSAVATITFVTSFSIGLGPIPWMVAAETVPFNASGAAQSISLVANWIATWMVSYGFPVLAAAGIGKGGMFFIFAAMAVVGGAFIYYRVPETKDMTVDEAWRDLEDKGPGGLRALGLGGENGRQARMD